MPALHLNLTTLGMQGVNPSVECPVRCLYQMNIFFGRKSWTSDLGGRAIAETDKVKKKVCFLLLCQVKK